MRTLFSVFVTLLCLVAAAILPLTYWRLTQFVGGTGYDLLFTRIVMGCFFIPVSFFVLMIIVSLWSYVMRRMVWKAV